MEQTREKIAILGGGISSLAAVWELALQDRYDITVYQMGWRLGGKGASGRNQEIAERIEEHGLHIWFGFYENAFNVMRLCYEQVQTVPSVESGRFTPFPSVRKAFTGEDTFILADKAKDGEWAIPPWQITLPGDETSFPGEPGPEGEVTEFPTLWEYLTRTLEFAYRHFHSHLHEPLLQSEQQTSKGPGIVGGLLRSVGLDVSHMLGWGLRIARVLGHDLVKTLHLGWLRRLVYRLLAGLLRRFKQWLNHVADDSIKGHIERRRAWILVDLALTSGIGMLADGVFHRGLDALNCETYRDWLRRHDADPISIDSPPIQAFHDAAFAYEDGDTEKPNMAAGVALRALLRIIFTYKGHVFFKMNAGMGDAIFAPLYLVLKERYGVEFRFFHEVKELRLSPDGNQVQEIRVDRQVSLRDGKKAQEYDPLINVGGLPCWPNRPDQKQIVQDLRQTEENPEGVNLESHWADWSNAGETTLVAGDHFDRVVLGIPLGALRSICPQLIEADPCWQQMVDTMKTVKTQSVQLWFQPSDTALEWPVKSSIVGSYAEPYASWADFDQLEGRERWPESLPQKSVFYCCNAMPDDPDPVPPPSDHAYPAQQRALARDTAMQQLRTNASFLWPQGTDAGSAVKWELLTAPEQLQGEERATRFQYFRANVNPWERYVLSIAKAEQYRLKPEKSGFDNLFLTGTWTDNGFNLSSIEAAVMSGMKAARAICGKPIHIVGEGDFLD